MRWIHWMECKGVGGSNRGRLSDIYWYERLKYGMKLCDYLLCMLDFDLYCREVSHCDSIWDVVHNSTVSVHAVDGIYVHFARILERRCLDFSRCKHHFQVLILSITVNPVDLQRWTPGMAHELRAGLCCIQCWQHQPVTMVGSDSAIAIKIDYLRCSNTVKLHNYNFLTQNSR